MKPARCLSFLVVILAVTSFARAGVVGVQYNTSAPGSSLGGYELVPFAANGAPSGAAVSSVAVPAGSTPVGSVALSTALTHYTVGGGWGTWSHGYNGDVYWLDELSVGNAVTLTLPSLTKAFSFYVEPGFFGNFNLTLLASASDGTTWSLSPSIAGAGGAAGFGLYVTGASDVALTSITVTGLDTWPDGLAIGEFSINGVPNQNITGVPDAASAALLFAPVLALLAILRRFARR